MNNQNLLKNPQTNWKYVIIIVVLAAIVGGGILVVHFVTQEVLEPKPIEQPEQSIVRPVHFIKIFKEDPFYFKIFGITILPDIHYSPWDIWPELLGVIFLIDNIYLQVAGCT